MMRGLWKLIKEREVLTLLIPYPNINSNLAVESHMYIVKNNQNFELIKCQTLKPNMINSSRFRKYIDVNPDINTNPFIRATRVDCDKLFKTYTVEYDDRLKASRDIEEKLYNNILAKMEEDNDITYINLDEDKLVRINPLVSYR